MVAMQNTYTDGLINQSMFGRSLGPCIYELKNKGFCIPVVRTHHRWQRGAPK